MLAGQKESVLRVYRAIKILFIQWWQWAVLLANSWYHFNILIAWIFSSVCEYLLFGYFCHSDTNMQLFFLSAFRKGGDIKRTLAKTRTNPALNRETMSSMGKLQPIKYSLWNFPFNCESYVPQFDADLTYHI